MSKQADDSIYVNLFIENIVVPAKARNYPFFLGSTISYLLDIRHQLPSHTVEGHREDITRAWSLMSTIKTGKNPSLSLFSLSE